MNIYRQDNFENVLTVLWDKTLVAYKKGRRSPEEFFDEEELLFLNLIGISSYDIYDHVEDFVQYGEPNFLSFLLVTAVRRDYFVYAQNQAKKLDLITDIMLPSETAAYENIAWLPRITAKAYAKVKGELHPTVMYGCFRDRQFLKPYAIHPSDFLRAVWRCQGDLPKVHAWLLSLKDNDCF